MLDLPHQEVPHCMAVDVIIVGAGPAGLSAALHAKNSGLDVLVLERSEIANTVVQYHKGKYVMADPAVVPLRSALPFEAGSRETVLDTWSREISNAGLDIRCLEEVRSIVKTNDVFTVHTDKGEHTSRHVVLAVGVQGIPRTLDVPGEQLPHVSSRLDDPSMYHDLDIVVVGGGEAAIEEALALSEHNRVVIVNRNKEFFRLKDALKHVIVTKARSGHVRVYHNATVQCIDRDAVDLGLPDSAVTVAANAVFKRIGADVPRDFLARVGIVFLASVSAHRPALGVHNETETPGLYLIGAAAGIGLIKQGINQGYDVIEHILGHDVEPADEPLIKEKLAWFPGSTDEGINHIITTVPLLAKVTKPMLRDILLDSQIHQVRSGDIVFTEHDFSDSFYLILDGAVEITVASKVSDGLQIVMAAGNFFGEMSLLSGRRRSGTVRAVQPSVLLEVPRLVMIRLLNDEKSVSRALDVEFIVRTFGRHLLPNADPEVIRQLALKAQIETFHKNDVIFRQGKDGDAMYLIRSGSVKISQRGDRGEDDIVINYLPAYRYFGEMALLDPHNPYRTATVTAVTKTEVIKVMKADFEWLLTQHPEFEQTLRQRMQKTLIGGDAVALREMAGGDVIGALIGAEIFQGTNVLLIDQNKCLRCDECVTACADTHEGSTRLNRTDGIAFANLLVPTSCRHCENPLCLTDCPPGDAILRDPNGEVYIRDNCIGCGNCARLCPYGNILMVQGEKKAGLFEALLSRLGFRPEQLPEAVQTKAAKCDLCRGLPGGPACVRACPTGAAFRVSPEEYFHNAGMGH